VYRNWWIPVQEIIVIDTAKKKENQSQVKAKEQTEKVKNIYFLFRIYLFYQYMNKIIFAFFSFKIKFLQFQQF